MVGVLRAPALSVLAVGTVPAPATQRGLELAHAGDGERTTTERQTRWFRAPPGLTAVTAGASMGEGARSRCTAARRTPSTSGGDGAIHLLAESGRAPAPW
mmetsp:Transcript_57117/g.167714  ORF Transcript_57117/g.167714 Transcript_57117/m.167714 type:complete len:100 (-) Transcript_57117:943-1242(-)